MELRFQSSLASSWGFEAAPSPCWLPLPLSLQICPSFSGTGRGRMGPFLTPLGTARWADAGLMADPGPLERIQCGRRGKSRYSTEHMPVEGPSCSRPWPRGCRARVIWHEQDVSSNPTPATSHTNCMNLGSCGWSPGARSQCLHFLICKKGVTVDLPVLGNFA